MACQASDFIAAASQLSKDAADVGKRSALLHGPTFSAASLALHCFVHSLSSRWSVDIPHDLKTVQPASLGDPALPAVSEVGPWSEDEITESCTFVCRLVRNLCVNDDAKLESFRSCGGLQLLLSVAHLACSDSSSRHCSTEGVSKMCTASLQAIGNSLVSRLDIQREVWDKGWPQPLSLVSGLSEQELSRSGVVAMIVYNCLRSSSERAVQFAHSEPGGTFLRDLLRCTYQCVEIESEKEGKARKDITLWTELIATVLIEKAGLAAVHSRMSTLQASADDVDSEMLLLYFLEDAMSESKGSDASESEALKLDKAACGYLATEFGLLLNVCLERRKAQAESDARTVAKLLQVLQVLAAVTATDQERGARTAMREEGLVRNCVELLRAVTEARRGDRGAALGGQQGLKRDLVRIIGNACYQDRACQDLVRELGGIPLVLSQTTVDDNNPYAREWSVWAIRNLCENNLENQAEIDSLKAQRVASTPPELRERGIVPEVDPTTGKLTFSRVGAENAAPARQARGGVESVERMAEELAEMGLRAHVDPDTGLVDIAHPAATPSRFSYPAP